jgi:hypothetical protein
MKKTNFLFALLALGLFAPAGCKKSEPTAGPTNEYYGVKIDVAKLDAEFANPSLDVLSQVLQVKRFFHYQQFPQAVLELNKLAQMPGLTESQKKLVSDLIGQTKQVIAKATSPSGP